MSSPDASEGREPQTLICYPPGEQTQETIKVMEPFEHVVSALSHPVAVDGGWPIFERRDGSPVAVNPALVESVVPCV